MLDTVSPKVSGANFHLLTVKFCVFPVGLKTVTTTDLGGLAGTFPKLAETGLNQVVPLAAWERFSRPAPCAVGPTSWRPVLASFTTRSARLTSSDLICAGDQSWGISSSTAAEPAMRGVDMDVHLKKG